MVSKKMKISKTRHLGPFKAGSCIRERHKNLVKAPKCLISPVFSDTLDFKNHDLH